MNTSSSIPVVYICDTKYVIPTCISILSILQNSRSTFNFYIIAKDLSKDDKNEFKKIKCSQSTITIIDAKPNKQIQSVIAQTYVTVSALYKFMIPDLLPKLDKVIYLDGDTVIKNDLAKLFNTNIDNFHIAAVLDAYVMGKSKENEALGLKRYFNSGVLLLNCKKMRLDNSSEELIKTKLGLKNARYMDQDTLNVVFKDTFLPLDCTFNCFPAYLTPQYARFVRDNLGYSVQEYNDLVKNIVIIHYAGKKPWDYQNIIFQKTFTDIYKNSPWKDIPLQYKDRFNPFKYLKHKIFERKATSVKKAHF